MVFSGSVFSGSGAFGFGVSDSAGDNFTFGSGRSLEAPAIKFSLQLNPDAKAYNVLNSMSDAPRLLSFMIIKRKGDIDEFVKIYIPFKVTKDGMAVLEINYLASITFIVEDADKDGMPDDWEKQNGLNMNDPSDQKQMKMKTESAPCQS